GIVLIHSTTWELDASVGRRAAGEWALVLGFEGEFDSHDVATEDRVSHEVTIPGEPGDEGPHELLANRRSPLHEAARNLDRHVFRVVRHDAVLVGSAPRVVVRGDERFDVGDGSERAVDRAIHCLFGWHAAS